MAKYSGKHFKGHLSKWLRGIPRKTPRGKVLKTRETVHFGSPGGAHEPVLCWDYRPDNIPIKMLFGFFRNYTPWDIICKVLPVEDHVKPGTGATLQLNSENSLDEYASILSHSGLITVKTRIPRARLFSLICKLSPEVAEELKIDPKDTQQVTLGNVKHFSKLIDNLFSYACGVERSKSHLRNEPMLSISAALKSKDSAANSKSLFEGAVKRTESNKYERNAKARALCIAHYGSRCAVCGYSLDQIYGAVARDLIHVHHLKPISKARKRARVDPIKDLRPICPNCHYVIHSRNPEYPITQVKRMISKKIGS